MKKFLSLVLALVMTMSLVTVSAGAAYKDDSKITYAEAVAVASACGIVEGFPDGTFAPTDTLTRAQAAKIICVMMMGSDAAATLSADAAPFSDVPATHWAAGYIAYCAQEDIIAGLGNGTFGPDQELTGFAFMKMLLVALGYDATFEGLVGSNWSVNVAKLVSDCDLDDDNDNFVGKNVVTREEACLYVLNTLKATMVEYDNNTSTITVGNTTIISNAKAEEKEWSNGTKNSKDKTIDNDGLVQFAEKHFEDLECETKTDDLGRTGTKWIYDDKTVGTFADSADDSMVIIKSLDAQQILVTDSDFFDYDEDDFADKITVYVNGYPELKNGSYDDLKDVDLKAGDEVELYENDDDEVDTVVVIRYTLAVIDEIETDLSSTYTKKGATCSITLETLDGSSIGGTYYDVYEDHDDEVLVGFSADTYEEDTILAVALNDEDEVLASHVADTITGEISSYNTGSKAKITINGDTYQLHDTLSTSKSKNVSRKELSLNLNDDSYEVYVDKNGYVIGIDTESTGSVDDVFYVTGIFKDSSRSTTYYAQAVDLEDGTVTEYQMNTDYTIEIGGKKVALKDLGYDDGFAEVKGLYEFEKEDGKYYAEPYDGGSDYDIVKLGAIGDDLERGDSKMTIGGKKVYLEDSTVFIKVEDDAEDIEVKYIEGDTSARKTNVSAIAICDDDEAVYVILISDSFSNASSDDLVFIAEKSSTQTTYTDSDGDSKKAFETTLIWLDGSGKVETVLVDGSAKAVGVYTYEINDDDVYELESDMADSKLTVSDPNGEYDDETGYIMYAMLTDYRNGTISGYDTESDIYFEDVDLTANIVIDDDRSKGDRDKDYYTNEITSEGRLESAIDKNNGESGIIATLYLDDEEVIAIYVWEMAGPKD